MMTARIIKIDAEHMEDSLFDQIAEVFDWGGIVGYPTETVYGLGGDATNEKAVGRIFEIKGRQTQKPFLCLIHSKERLYPIVDRVSEKAERLMDAFWPGPLTLLFSASGDIPELVCGVSGKIGIRVSNDPVCQRLTRCYSKPIVSTSANRSGQKPARSADQVIEFFGNDLDLVLDGGKRNGLEPSTVLDVTENPPCVIRKGAVSMERIRNVIGDVVERKTV
jgi:L-threonylcarbamoyladenylate synthase